MELGMIGLGRMGGNMTRRLLRGGHRVVVFDPDPEAASALAADGAVPADSIDDMVGRLSTPRAVWTMVPAGEPTEATLDRAATCSPPATSSSTAATPTTRTAHAAPPLSNAAESTCSTSAPAAESGA